MILPLKSYVRWQRRLFWESVAVALCFIFLKCLSVGFKNVGPLLEKTYPYNAGLAFFAVFVALGLQNQFRRFLKEERISAVDCSEIRMGVILGKSIYMTAWLIFLFYPLKSDLLYDHLVGFAFVVAAISGYSSISAVYYPLFLFDVGLQLAMVALILALNSHVQETRWFGGAVMVFGIYNLFTGRIMSQTTANLFQSQSQIVKSMRLAETANRGKMDFLAMMSHEIRTPMTGVLGMVDFLKQTPLNPEQQTCMKTLAQCSETLLNTLNDVIDTAREEAGSLTLKYTNCEIREVILAATRSMEHVAQKKGLSLDVNIQDDMPEMMYADPYRLQQVLFNLLNNAIKFTQKGGIIVTANLQHNELLFGVTDTGIGMTEEQQQRLFRKFSQADATISQKFGGSGLGLSIAKTLVELMGGKIKCVSQPRKGTTFYFWIPYRPPMADEGVVEKAVVGGGTANVLLVEDNQVNQMIAIRYLTKHGHHVVLAENGEAALARLREGQYDIILMDSNMPGKSGLEIAREIRKRGPPFSEIPIIAVTANAMQTHIDDCMRAGMADHLIKPYSSDQICAMIAKHVAKVREAPPQEEPVESAAAPAAAPVEAPLPGKLPVFAEEFGVEYAHALARKSMDEMDRLLGIITTKKPKPKPADIAGAAHDLKSISGYIGLTRIQAAAEAVEKSAETAEKAPRELPGLIAKLLEVYGEDVPVMRKTIPADAAQPTIN